MPVITATDTDLLRLHRRACTDFAARLRLPAWEHLKMELAEPLAPRTIADLLIQVASGNLKAAAAMCGQPEPATADLELDQGEHPSEVVVESIRTVLTVAAGLAVAARSGAAGSGAAAPASELSPSTRELLWNRAAELTVLGYDLQQAIQAGAGLDDLLVDGLLAADAEPNVWPHLPPLPIDQGTPPVQRLLALTGRPPGMWVDPADPACGTGQC